LTRLTNAQIIHINNCSVNRFGNYSKTPEKKLPQKVRETYMQRK
jgi:5-methylcytosine-specific restriction endonuclease McrA